MQFKITHSTDYLFDSEVFLEPHFLRFRPRETPYLKVIDFSLTIQPKPVGHRTIQDEDNNVVDFCWFEGLTNQLAIKAESIVEIKPYNPFNFIIHPQTYNQLPFQYNKEQKPLLFSTLEQQPISKALINYGENIQKEAQHNTLPYLTQLTKQLHEDFKVEYREDGFPLNPDETFTIKKGSCRDLSWMLIHLLRHQGFATRFVSGYFYFDMEEPAYELHAWVEVFLPGTGWLGLDPSHGIFTGNMHFPIVSSAHFENTMPVSGGIRGSASSKLITQLSIEKI
ncbi:transglutaminase-like putative cysteine protease [Flavobacteriaceae bacterium MAR_2010_105]|nr:transglutaminase-like putative cysteine protease [Flavobacteriaceae bacterium MAR_2010_105]